MTPPMIPADPREREGLAAEYVLGTLDARDAAEVEAALPTDAALRADVEAWERRLAPLQALAVPEAPPPELWDRIEAALAGTPAARPAAVRAQAQQLQVGGEGGGRDAARRRERGGSDGRGRRLLGALALRVRAGGLEEEPKVRGVAREGAEVAGQQRQLRARDAAAARRVHRGVEARAEAAAGRAAKGAGRVAVVEQRGRRRRKVRDGRQPGEDGRVLRGGGRQRQRQSREEEQRMEAHVGEEHLRGA